MVTEPVIQRARRFDRVGDRTVGIITKPDLINEETEGRIVRVVNSQDETKLKLGFFGEKPYTQATCRGDRKC